MTTTLHAYLNFRDNARQAMEFYHSVFGGTLDVSTFGEYHASDDPAEADKIMHAQLNGDNGIVFMASDTPNNMDYAPFASVSLSLSGDNEAELTNYYHKLSEGGTVVMPLAPSPWSDVFGMFKDKFGMSWMVNIGQPKA